MDDQKVLAYFNIDKNKKFDSFFISLSAGFEIGVGAFYLMEIAFKIIPCSPTTLLLGVFQILLGIFFMVFGRHIKNPTREYPIVFLIWLMITVHLFAASFLSFRFEQERLGIKFGVEYFAILFTAFILAGIIIGEKIKALNFLKKYPIDEARKKVASRKINKWVFPAGCMPGGLLFVYRILRNEINPVLTLCSWGLASIFLIIVLVSGYNLITAIYYGLFKAYKREMIK